MLSYWGCLTGSSSIAVLEVSTIAENSCQLVLRKERERWIRVRGFVRGLRTGERARVGFLGASVVLFCWFGASSSASVRGNVSVSLRRGGMDEVFLMARLGPSRRLEGWRLAQSVSLVSFMVVETVVVADRF